MLYGKIEPMEIQIAAAKINKFISQGSGDTVEVIERPYGGVSIVLADGKLNGLGQKAISTEVVHRVINCISDRMNDGTSVSATSNYLFMKYAGKAKSSLNILSYDLNSNTIVISRNNTAPVVVIMDEKMNLLQSESPSIGISAHCKSSITEIDIQPGTSIIMFSDGIFNAGQASGLEFNINAIITALFEEQEPTAQEIVDFLLSQAVSMDQSQPEDDMCVVAMQIVANTADPVRKIFVKLPII